MHRKLWIFNSLIMVGLLMRFAIAQQVGLMPVPIFTEAKVESQVAYDSSTGLYTYWYIITNPATNTGEIRHIDIDTTRPANSVTLSSEGLTIPLARKTKTFDELLAMTNNLTLSLIPVGMRVPYGWTGGLAEFGSVTDRIMPGEIQSGFEIISRGLPTIREIKLVPRWVLLVESEETVTPEEKQLAKQIKASLPFRTKTLGPTAPPSPFDPVKFLKTIRGYINESATRGWLIDPSLTSTLLAKLDTAESFLNANDPSKAKITLQEFMTNISEAQSTQRTTEAYGLLYFNAKYLREQLPDTPLPPPPPIPHLELTPKDASHPIGEIHTLTPSFWVEQGNSTYFPSVPVRVKVTSGPNTGLVMEAVPSGTDPMSVNYTSNKEGIDRLEAQVEEVPEVPDVTPGIPGATSMPVKVTWTGGPDLTIDLFIPPIIKAQGGQFIPITEITGNHGNSIAGSSITRYFLSQDDIIDPNQDRPVGERFVSLLASGESSEERGMEIQLPDDLPQGIHHLGACADADQSIIELNEANNCQVNQIVVALEQVTNQPPDCTQAIGSPNKLWPPNHKLVSIAISGITDPDGDPVTLIITKITQDEPVNGLGDGDTSPDGFGIGASQAQVRAERSGTGNGRVYAISFTADDGKGGNCTGAVKIGVPHDQGKGAIPVDDGQIYDSTAP